MGALSGDFRHSVLSKNSGPSLVGVISGLGVLTGGVLSGFHCILILILKRSLPFLSKQSAASVDMLYRGLPQLRWLMCLPPGKLNHAPRGHTKPRSPRTYLIAASLYFFIWCVHCPRKPWFSMSSGDALMKMLRKATVICLLRPYS